MARESMMTSRPGHRHGRNGGRPVTGALRFLHRLFKRSKTVHLALRFLDFAFLLPLPNRFAPNAPMRGCLKHHSPDSSTIATPPPTRSPTPPLIPPDAPSLAVKRRRPPTLTDACLSPRCVHFCSELVDKIYVADEWDRSPASVTPRLTYQ